MMECSNQFSMLLMVAVFAYQKRWMLQPAMLEDWRMNSVIPSLSSWRGCIWLQGFNPFCKIIVKLCQIEIPPREWTNAQQGILDWFLRSLGEMFVLFSINPHVSPSCQVMHHPNPRASNVSGEDEHGHADCELQRLIESLVWKKEKSAEGWWLIQLQSDVSLKNPNITD